MEKWFKCTRNSTSAGLDLSTIFLEALVVNVPVIQCHIFLTVTLWQDISYPSLVTTEAALQFDGGSNIENIPT
jgi:hypothetical protein